LNGRTLGAAGQAEGGDGADGGKDILGDELGELARGRVLAEEGEMRAGGGEDLLVLGAGEEADDGVGDGGGALEGQ
jgi:hypothetical protein